MEFKQGKLYKFSTKNPNKRILFLCYDIGQDVSYLNKEVNDRIITFLRKFPESFYTCVEFLCDGEKIYTDTDYFDTFDKENGLQIQEID